MSHCDLKLENILVDDNGTLKLCDFGMVQPVEADLSLRQGTEMYAAPEIINKNSSETYKGVPADIFTLGVLFWILRFAAPPFHSSKSNDRNYQLLQRRPDAYWRLHPCVKRGGQSLDEDFVSLLTSMLEADASKRPQSVAEVMGHPFFTKEDGLEDSFSNVWRNKAELEASFKAKLVALFDQTRIDSSED